MVCWQMVRFLIQLRPSMYFDVSLISLQIQSIQCMLHEARCWKYMSSIICLQSQLFEEACFVNLFGWWFCTPICKSTWTYSHDVNFFFFEGENDVFSVWWFCLWQDVTRFCEGPLFSESLMITTYPWESNGSASLFWRRNFNRL